MVARWLSDLAAEWYADRIAAARAEDDPDERTEAWVSLYVGAPEYLDEDDVAAIAALLAEAWGLEDPTLLRPAPEPPERDIDEL